MSRDQILDEVNEARKILHEAAENLRILRAALNPKKEREGEVIASSSQNEILPKAIKPKEVINQ